MFHGFKFRGLGFRAGVSARVEEGIWGLGLHRDSNIPEYILNHIGDPAIT